METKPVIIIPVYKKDINENEQWSLRQCFKMLGTHPIVFVMPKGLNLSAYIPFTNNIAFSTESFHPNFFSDIQGYNRLMLSPEFYERFINYSHMLIYQLDAFVFKDDLMYWCDQDFDYIGAPWIVRPKFTRRVRSFFHYKLNLKQNNGKSPTLLQFYNRVGNGGFSLRNIKKFYEICNTHQKQIAYYNARNSNHFFNEDVFWSIEVNRKKTVLKIPGYKKALRFSIEQKPDLGLSLLSGTLPFGMHAWYQYPNVWHKIMLTHTKDSPL